MKTKQPGHDMEWNGMENGMEWKFRYGIWTIPEWNEKEDFKNGKENNLPYFHTKSILGLCIVFTEKYILMSGSDKILSQQNSPSISAHIICGQIAVLWLCTLRKQCPYCIIVSTLQFNCSIDVTVDDLDRFDLLVFFVFFFRLTICPVVNFVFLRHENSYLLFHPRFAEFYLYF